jgi:hypothetical protein
MKRFGDEPLDLKRELRKSKRRRGRHDLFSNVVELGGRAIKQEVALTGDTVRATRAFPHTSFPLSESRREHLV